jgi:hypothetical protein
MATFEERGFVLAGAEYWPYAGDREPNYPEEILWGFYPRKGIVPPGETDPNRDDASPAAIACAERAHRELRELLASPLVDELRAIVDVGAAGGFTNRFYLWVNDYSRASDPFPPGVRPARLWYWKRKTPDPNKPPGYWKWESTLTRSGECRTPLREETVAYLKKTRSELAR